jgi:trans-aconitate methyltransferase
VTVDDHFKLVAPVYDSLRTTDKAPVRRIREMLPNSLLVGLDLGCGTGRYSRLLHALLPDGSLLAASDVSAAMLVSMGGCIASALTVSRRRRWWGAVLGAVFRGAGRGLGAVAAG